MSGTQGDQKRVFGTSITDVCEPPYEFRESNSGPLEDPQGHLTTEPSSLQHQDFISFLSMDMRMHMCVCMCVCIYTQLCVPKGAEGSEDKRRHQNPESWSYRLLQAGCLEQQR